MLLPHPEKVNVYINILVSICIYLMDQEETLLNNIRVELNPTDNDKDHVFKTINQLSAYDHQQIFTDILYPMENKIYTVTDNNILFDLSDLSNKQFWQLVHMVYLFQLNQTRQQLVNKIQIQHDTQITQLDQDLISRSQIFQADQNIQSELDTITNEKTYDSLRIKALENCSYSNFYDCTKKLKIINRD